MLGFGAGAALCTLMFIAGFAKELSGFCERVLRGVFYLFLGLLTLVSGESLREPRDSLVELGGIHWTEFSQQSCIFVLEASYGANALL